MPPTLYQVGTLNALRDFGVKSAYDMRDFKNTMSDFKDTVLTTAFGQPREAVKQIFTGRYLHPQRGLVSQYLPKTLGSAAAQFVPVILGSLGTALEYPEVNKGELAGDTVARTVGSILGAPFGVAGQVAGGSLLAPVGQAVGKSLSDLWSRVRRPSDKPSDEEVPSSGDSQSLALR